MVSFRQPRFIEKFQEKKQMRCYVESKLEKLDFELGDFYYSFIRFCKILITFFSHHNRSSSFFSVNIRWPSSRIIQTYCVDLILSFEFAVFTRNDRNSMRKYRDNLDWHYSVELEHFHCWRWNQVVFARKYKFDVRLSKTIAVNNFLFDFLRRFPMVKRILKREKFSLKFNDYLFLLNFVNSEVS